MRPPHLTAPTLLTCCASQMGYGFKKNSTLPRTCAAHSPCTPTHFPKQPAAGPLKQALVARSMPRRGLRGGVWLGWYGPQRGPPGPHCELRSPAPPLPGRGSYVARGRGCCSHDLRWRGSDHERYACGRARGHQHHPAPSHTTRWPSGFGIRPRKLTRGCWPRAWAYRVLLWQSSSNVLPLWATSTCSAVLEELAMSARRAGAPPAAHPALRPTTRNLQEREMRGVCACRS